MKRIGLLVLLAALPVAPAWSQATGPGYTLTPNGKPARDFEGVWWPMAGGGARRGGGAPDGAAPGGAAGGGTRAGGGGPPGGGATVQLTGTTLQCAPVQRLSGSGGGMTAMIIQAPDQLVMISEEDMDIARKVYIGGTHPADVVPQPNGHSIGSWDGDTLVIDTVGFADRAGKNTGQHVVERMHKEADRLVSDMVLTDKNGNMRTQAQNWGWRPELQFNENVCEEGFDRYQVINGQLDNPNIPPDRVESK